MLVYLSIKSYNDWVNFFSHIKLSIVFRLCTTKIFYSNNISSTGEVFNPFNHAIHQNFQCKRANEMPAKYCKKNCCAKKSQFVVYVLTRNWLPRELLLQQFWKESV